MSLFTDILGDISKRLRSVETYKEDIAFIITTTIGITIQADQISIKKGILYIAVSPTIKSAIRLKQTALLVALKQYKITTIG